MMSMEEQDARELTSGMFDPAPNLLVCDASFISITKVLGMALALTQETVLLIKPQFEVGRENIDKGGIVRGGADAALEAVTVWLREQGWGTLKMVDSPIEGGSGNREFLLHAKRQSDLF